MIIVDMYLCGSHQLQDGQVFLPPQELGDVRAEHRQSVIAVHQDVDSTVDHGWQEGYKNT